MKLTDLNRPGGIGANSLFIQLGDFNLLLDCGLHPKLTGRIAAPDFSLLRGKKLDLIVISHCHLDHIGSLPIVMREHAQTPVVMSASSRLLIERMLHNSANVMLRQREEDNVSDYPLFTHEEIDRCASRFHALAYGQNKRFSSGNDEIVVTLHSAGHVAGAAGIEIRHKHRTILYTGDVQFEDQRTIKGAKFPTERLDTLITESTRCLTERPPDKSRGAEMSRLIDSINDTIQRGGSYLIPLFALGRMQEILAVVHDARKLRRLVDCPIFASGLGMDLADYFDEIARKTKHVQFSKRIIKDLQIKPLPRAIENGRDYEANALYLVSSGMMVERTPSYAIASGLLGNARNTIGFVGYCDPDTPGGTLLATKPGDTFVFEAAKVKTKVKARIERFDLSAHADREELLAYAQQTKPRSIVVTHGDPPAREWLMKQLAATMPSAKLLNPEPLTQYQV